MHAVTMANVAVGLMLVGVLALAAAAQELFGLGIAALFVREHITSSDLKYPAILAFVGILLLPTGIMLLGLK